MAKKTLTKQNTAGLVKRVLIAQPKPEGDKSPYYDLAKKHNLELDFHPFVVVQGVPGKDFRKQKIDIAYYTGIIFTSKNAIDHFFRICEELKIVVAQETKYFCITEAVALYLQKFILFRKRKVFYGADGTTKGLLDVINRHKDNEKFLYPCSEAAENEITIWLSNHQCEYATPQLFRTVSNDIKEVIAKGYDVICLVNPGAVKSLFDNFPEFKQNGTMLGAFGPNTFRAAEEAGLRLDIKAPLPQAPSMVSALDLYLAEQKKEA